MRRKYNEWIAVKRVVDIWSQYPCRSLAGHHAPEVQVLWCRVLEKAPYPRQLYRVFIGENVLLVGRVKLNSA